ncbi:MAG TPA: hypothetical protein DD670_20310 [Planctomycetaceae bacterium]|nr:hypothetical protein [Planctomycetaceae bacterium]
MWDFEQVSASITWIANGGNEFRKAPLERRQPARHVARLEDDASPDYPILSFIRHGPTGWFVPMGPRAEVEARLSSRYPPATAEVGSILAAWTARIARAWITTNL